MSWTEILRLFTETKRLKEQVRRNIERFPEDFMFELTKEELKNWRSQFATSNSDKMGLRYKAIHAMSQIGVSMRETRYLWQQFGLINVLHERLSPAVP